MVLGSQGQPRRSAGDALVTALCTHARSTLAFSHRRASHAKLNTGAAGKFQSGVRIRQDAFDRHYSYQMYFMM